MSNSVRPHRQQPTRLPRPWDSLGKNTGVGCHFLLQCMKVKNESELVQSCPTLHDPMNCSLLVSSVRGIFQAIVLEWGAITFSNPNIVSIYQTRVDRSPNYCSICDYFEMLTDHKVKILGIITQAVSLW